MTLALAVETSSAVQSVALGGAGEVPVRRTLRRDDPAFRSIGELVSAALAAAGCRFADVGRIAVDVGPGNLSSVRAGVAYVNGLAFSLGIPVVTANALELMAMEVAETEPGPVLCLRNAGSGNVYAGLFAAGTVAMRHGRIEAVVASLAGELPEVSVAGTFRAEIARLLPRAVVKDTGVEVPSVSCLFRMLAAAADGAPRLGAAATPLTETSAVFDAVS